MHQITKNVIWHDQQQDQVLTSLSSSKNGLTDKEARARLEQYGYNEIMEEKRQSIFVLFARQFTSPLIIILLAATVISLFTGETIDAIVIVAIVVLAALVGFVQEIRSERAIEFLKQMTSSTITTLRDGKEKITKTRNLVPGDVILVSVGDRVPADSYILESFSLQTNESSLSGESTPVEKSACVLHSGTPLAERKNTLYMITTVTHGRAKAIVFSTGMNTELGRVAGTLQTIKTEKSPFELRMKRIGTTLSLIMLVIVAAVAFVGFLRGFEILNMFIWGTSLAVAAVPEALPAVVTTSLTVGVYHMAKQNAIIRRLPAVETLGSTTVICSDKTGTLTKGEMTVRKIYVDDKTCNVSGVGYEPKGRIENGNIQNDDLLWFAKCAVLCNDASIVYENGTYKTLGDTTEAALVVVAEKIGITKKETENWPRLSEIQFSSERKRMTTIHNLDGIKYAIMKGATEIVLDRCTLILQNGQTVELDELKKSTILGIMDDFAKDGLRVLALASKKILSETSEGEIENNLVFIGLAGMIDPPRDNMSDAISQCKSAGINVVMITGDHKTTAEAIAKDIGIFDVGSSSLTGNDLDNLSGTEFAKIVENVSVYARVTSEHKMKIIDALQSKGHVVAMTGDGINDATSLKSADIGIAMGITGTQVTKEASSMILADDNFASIVFAVREGRKIMDNVRKYLVYLLSVNVGEMILLAFPIVIGWPMPLLAKHILFVNLVTDGPPAIALGLEPAEPDTMKQKPLKLKEGIFRGTIPWLVGISLLTATISIVLFWHVLEQNEWSDYGVEKARTMVFVFLVFEEIFFALSCRSLRLPFSKLGLFRNKFLVYSLIAETALILVVMNLEPSRHALGLTSLDLHEWLLVFVLSPIAFTLSEILKLAQKH